jgi:hypothetical protein
MTQAKQVVGFARAAKPLCGELGGITYATEQIHS